MMLALYQLWPTRRSDDDFSVRTMALRFPGGRSIVQGEARDVDLDAAVATEREQALEGGAPLCSRTHARSHAHVRARYQIAQRYRHYEPRLHADAHHAGARRR